jgi:hypothetical protein
MNGFYLKPWPFSIEIFSLGGDEVLARVWRKVDLGGEETLDETSEFLAVFLLHVNELNAAARRLDVADHRG